VRCCCVAGLSFAVLSHAAEVYVYEQRTAAVTSWVEVTCDGRPSASIKAGYVFALQLDAGRHTLTLKDGVPVTIQVAASEPTFVRLDWNMSVTRAPIPVLSPVTPAQARRDLEFLTYIPKDKIFSPQVLREDPRRTEYKELKHRGLE
jgi:hypothetical protein